MFQFITSVACVLCALSAAEEGAATTTQTLAEADLWVIAPPKTVTLIPDVVLELNTSLPVWFVSSDSREGRATARTLAQRLSKASGLSFKCQEPASTIPAVRLGVFSDGNPGKTLKGITSEDMDGLGAEGYALHIDADGVSLAARDWPGLFHGAVTLAQMAVDRHALPGMHVRDWPALRYRGVQQDISRGQVPTMDTFVRLTDILAEAHCNILELYIEHTFKFASHPDISPPEGITPEEGRALFAYAADQHIEVHPLFQVLGHSYHILNKPQYQHLRIGPCEKQPWIMTFDVRKPEAVAFINELVNELCTTFPGTLFNVDITEIDCDGILEGGMTLEQVTDLVYGYVLQLNAMVQRHDMRLMIAQGPLDSTGHLAGMGPKLDTLPKDIIVGSYYCAGGPYKPAWERDFPRLQESGIDFFSQAWIGSHIRLMPPAQHAADFSDAEVSRGLEFGAIGSITTDWGDAGNYHFTGQTWFPFLYHGACAWTGAGLDRGYFNEAYTRLLYGVKNDTVARAFHLASNISDQTVKTVADDGAVVDNASYHFWEFFGDPFTRKEITSMADPGAEGQRILEQVDKAAALLETAQASASRNQDNIEQVLFGARSYQALGHKLLTLAHYNDTAYARDTVADELDALASEYEGLKTDFQRMWLAEDRENDAYGMHCDRFDWTIVPCREMAAKLREGQPNVDVWN